MAGIFLPLPLLLLAVLLHPAVAWTAYKPRCAYRPLATGFKIRMGDFGKVSPPWTIPNPHGFRCLKWAGTGSSSKLRLDDSVCYNVQVARTGRYALKLSPPRDKGGPRVRAVVRIFALPVSKRERHRFVEWIDYEGKRVMTKKKLMKGRRYQVCVTGRRTPFTACAIGLGHCSTGKVAQCAGGGQNLSEWGRYLSQCV